MMRPALARLHILLATDARVGLVIRHGTAKSVCTLLWDRDKDEFTLGQWIRGRINTDTCDLSPKGGYFLYSASKYSQAGFVEDWTVVSRTPYLKAVAYYPYRHQGGWFLNDGEYNVLGDAQLGEKEHPEMRRVLAMCPQPSLYIARQVRAGWSLEDSRRSFNGKLELVRAVGADWELRHVPGGAYVLRSGEQTIDTRGWDWADIDKKRLVWTVKGCLWSGIVRKDGVHEAKLLHDFNGMKFEAIAAPYEGGRPVEPKVEAAPKPRLLLPAGRVSSPPARKRPDRSKVRPDED